MGPMVDAITRKSVNQHILVRGAEHPETLYTSEGGLITIMIWHGTTVNRGDRKLSDLITSMRESMASLMENPGHALQVVFSRDPLPSRELVGQLVRNWNKLCRIRSLDLESLLGEREELLNRSIELEKCHLAVYTHPSAISRADHAEFVKRKSVSEKGETLPLIDCQTPGNIARLLYDRHEIYCRAVRRVLQDANQNIQTLSSTDQATVIAASLVPGRGEGGWKPRLLELARDKSNGKDPSREGQHFLHDRLPCVRMPTTPAQTSLSDLGFLGLEQLGMQIARDRVEIHPDNLLVVSDLIMAGFDLVLPPELVIPFNELLQHCLNDEQNYRWRMSWLLEPRGFQGQLLKRSLVEVFTFLSRNHNSRLKNAFRDLDKIDGEDDTVVRMRVCFAIWNDQVNLADFRKRVGSLRRAIERWSNCRTDQLTGDPMATILASMPGNGLCPTAPAMAIPLTHALALLPLNRPFSPWNEGTVNLLTQDGRIWPYQSASKLQDSWCDLIVGTPGSGKSVLLNTLNLGALLASNPSASEPEKLPLVSIIDIGASAAGLVELLTDSLPPEKQDQVQMARLSNSARMAINIFDTEIGCRTPLPLEIDFLSNFMQILLADAGNDSVRLSGLFRQLVLDAYKAYSDEFTTPKPYVRGTLAELDEAISSHELPVDRETSWWELVDMFSDLGAWSWAEMAQRHAVPLLTDLPVILRNPDIVNTYREMGLDGGERALTAMTRLINEAVSTWPMLSHPTCFAMTNARLRMIDLQDVAGRGSGPVAQRRSSLMYMLARHVVTRGYYLHPEEVAGLDLRPSQKERLMRLATNNRQQPKRLCYDEFHRTGGIPGVLAQVETDVREGRKHNVQLCLASQLLGDFSSSVRSLATGFWICSRFTDAEIANLGKFLDLDEDETFILRNRLGSPTRKGSNVFVVLETKVGKVRQLLVNRLPPSEIWAFSTTAEDMALRQALTDRLGGTEARRLLGKRFPGGSARTEIARRQKRADRQSVIAELAQELIDSGPDVVGLS